MAPRIPAAQLKLVVKMRIRTRIVNQFRFRNQIDKIKRLEITPGELALMPSACSVILTDLDTGEVLAMVPEVELKPNKSAYFFRRLKPTAEL